VTVLNDAYNASPLAMRAAFEALVRLGPAGSGRRLAVLGRMAELGADELDAHRQVLTEAAARGIDVYSVGTDLYEIAAPRRWPDVDAALAGLGELDLGPGDVVLVKGSRVVGLERLAAGLIGAAVGR
jgi:UDP-N-acetylmuramoyl-tripeptide--D-alanyl-D-alanine ligase